MKTKLSLLALLAIVLVACNEPIGEAALIDGGWELQKLTSDKSVYADLSGNTHLKDEPYTQEFENKERVWLFYEAHISHWGYFSHDGEGYWSGYVDDADHAYVVEGEGEQMFIVETSRSIIPGMEEHSTVTRYHVEKLTKSQMILTATVTPYISDLGTTVDVLNTYTFKRENSLLDWILNYINSNY